MTRAEPDHPEVAVVVPCYRVRRRVLDVLRGIGAEVARIYVVDDHCPERSGAFVKEHCDDPRVEILFHERRQGVGGATLSGYRRAIAGGADVIVKVDGDGQMDPALIPRLIRPVLAGEADYAKGNRFFRLEGLRSMPLPRLFGNSFLAFLTKFSTGYWDVFDPTNGFTAIHARVARALDLDKLSRGFFFESDLLFRLGTLRAVVVDVPMDARYGGEDSNLRIWRAGPEFFAKHLVNFAKRIFYGYYLRSFNIASLELVLGALLLVAGSGVGARAWWAGGEADAAATALWAVLPILVGVQLLLAFFSYDMQNVPRTPLHKKL